MMLQKKICLDLKVLKMENTLENKEKFFSQYYGQKVLLLDRENNKTHHVYSHSLCMVADGRFPSACLLLKHIIDISNYDSKKLSVIEADYRTEDVYKRGKVIASNLNLGAYNNYNAKITRMVDYLRSHGYALPFMGIPVDVLVEYCWIKLVESK